MLVWLSCGQTTAIGKPLCCLYRHAKLPTNWINRFLPYERVAKISKTTVTLPICAVIKLEWAVIKPELGSVKNYLKNEY